MTQDRLIPLSALQHHLFCPRQCALIHIDGLWAENQLTVEGKHLHERADVPGSNSKMPSHDSALGTRVVRAMPLLSERLGLIGKADCVEFPIDHIGEVCGPPCPVEYKRGKPKRSDADKVQLCAQALCLEEMTDTTIAEGALFYHTIRRRVQVPIDQSLRLSTIETITNIRSMIESNTTPKAVYSRKCVNCSLLNLCLPKGTQPAKNPRLYFSRALSRSLDSSNEANS